MVPPTEVVEFLQRCGVRAVARNDTTLLERFYVDLLRANRSTNLTRITSPADFWVKHVADSIAVGLVYGDILERPLKAADVGCGAGFPTVPLAWANRDLQLTAIDAAAKKAGFLGAELSDLGLGNCTVVAGQAREVARRPEFAGQFDVVLARAVAPGAKLVRECRHLLRPVPGSALFFYKTPDGVATELAATEREAGKHGLEVTVSPALELPLAAGRRQFLIVHHPGPAGDAPREQGEMTDQEGRA